MKKIKINSTTGKTVKKVHFDSKTKEIEKKAGKNSLFSYKKGWDTKKQANGESFKQGKFTESELKLLKHSICQIVQENNMGLDGLIRLISENDPKLRGIWSKVSENFPERSVKSCHNIAKRHFNPLNYKGKWTPKEEKRLVELVDSLGRKWGQIGQELDRTAENCRDKYKSMGEERHLLRNSENWSVLEIIKLLKLVQKCVDKRFIDKNIEEKVLENLKNKDDKNNEISAKKKKTKKDVFDDQMNIVGKYINFEIAKNIDFKDIQWTSIAEKLRTKSKDDCRNKWLLHIKNTFYSNTDYEETEDEDLIDQILIQKVENDNEIDWESIKNGHNVQENQCRWHLIKKRVSTRGFNSCSDILQNLSKMISERRKKRKEMIKYNNHSKDDNLEEKNELIELFKNEYS